MLYNASSVVTTSLVVHRRPCSVRTLITPPPPPQQQQQQQQQQQSRNELKEWKVEDIPRAQKTQTWKIWNQYNKETYKKSVKTSQFRF